MFMFLTWIRKIEAFAATSSIANVIIFVALFFVIIEGGRELANGERGGKGIGGGTEVVAQSWGQSIGFAVYAYEGIGIVLPVQQVTANK